MLERSFRLTFRNFTTLFFVVAWVTVPIHVSYSFAFRDVLALREVHSDIETFDETRKVAGVDRADLASARLAFLGLSILEIIMVPLAMRATRRVLDVDQRGAVPTSVDAWRRALTRRLGIRLLPSRRHLPALLGALAFAVAVGLLVERIGLFLAEPLARTTAPAALGLLQAASRAAAAPFFLVTAAEAAPRREGATRST